MKNKYDVSLEDVNFYYEDIIENAVNDEIFKYKRCVASLIKDILECGVDRNDYEEIKFIISKVKEIRERDLIALKEKIKPENLYSSNKDIINKVINYYYPKDKDDFLDKYDEEFTYDDDDKYCLNGIRIRKRERKNDYKKVNYDE